jgi:biotin operon repressor
MSNSDKIIHFLINNQATVNDIAEFLGISRQAVHRILNKLVAEGHLIKAGMPPKVFYSVSEQTPKNDLTVSKNFTVDDFTKKIIDENFLFITAFGKQLIGWDGFTNWCSERKQDIAKMSKLYIKTINKYAGFKKDGLVDGINKITDTFNDVALDGVFYLDFYSIEIFGKTKLGQLLLFAKQSQDIVLMNQLIDSIKPTILDVIIKFNIEGVAFIPPTVKREYQLMKQIQKRLNLDIRIIKLVKIKTPVIVPQKTLNKLEDRIINARETIVVDDNSKYKNILIVDDAIGSGSTLNEVAKKIRQKGICDGKIVGLAITGSSNGFDVISEV